jgi:glycosyltransferase involved in cell wall biosynthesis
MNLTIGIPVYNGEKYIEQTILKIINANFNWQKTEIIVSDNNSSDNTCDIVKKYGQIKLFKHDENLGFDINVDRIFTYAQGKYVWTIGADDILTTENVSEINSVVSHDVDYGVIFAGEAQKAEDIYDADEFLYKSNFGSGFISNNIINKKLWLNFNAKDFVSTGWIHYGMVVKIIKLAPSYILGKMYVEEIEETKHHKSWIKGASGILIGLNLVEIFDKMHLWGYTDSMKDRCKLVIKGAYPRAIVYAKATGFKPNWNDIKRFIKLYYSFWSFWLVDIWFLFLPGIIYSTSFKIYKKLKINA